MIPGLGQGKYKNVPGAFIVPENKEVLKTLQNSGGTSEGLGSQPERALNG